jgi:ferredoxin
MHDKDFVYEEDISFDEIKKIFNESDWDVGYLSEESFKKCALSPVKSRGGFQQFAENFTNHIHFSKLTNSIVLIRNGHTWDYTIYGEVNSLLKQSGLKDWHLVYTHYKEAAILSGLGVRARNSLIYSYKFGFDCHIVVVRFEKRIINYPKNKRVNYNLWKRCDDCDDCAKACPAGAIHNEGDNPLSYWIDSTKCIDFIIWGNDENIPSIKKFWNKNVHPEIDNKLLDNITSSISAQKHFGFSEPPWDNNGYSYDGQIVSKDNKPVDVPVCRECTSQPRCSKWNGKYPYDQVGDRKVIKIFK